MLHRLAVALAVVLLVGACAWLGYVDGERRGVDQLRIDANHRLDLFASTVDGIVTHSEHVPATIQLHPAILSLLRGRRATTANSTPANEYLRRLNAHVGSLAVFTLNDRGVVVASSNTEYADDSLIGNDVSFRPYFLEALSGRVGRHFAIGVAGGSAGYFVSHPIRDGARVVGVAVVKISLKPIEQTWDMVGAPALLADANNVVIDASRADWRYTALVPLTVEQRVDHQLTRLYNEVNIGEFSMAKGIIPQSEEQRIGDVLVLGRPLDGLNWRVMLFLDLKDISREARVEAAMAAVAAAFLMLLLLVLVQARRIQRQRGEARRVLERANAELEMNVRTRTRALTEANAQLTREVHEREQAEQLLYAAQNELVQTAKMAVLGQLATGITHELTQPLGAIRTLSGNAEEFLRRGQMEPLTGNLQIMSRLADQMGRIIEPLKTFARKSDPVRGPADVGHAIRDGLFLYGQRLRTMQVRVVNDCEPGSLFAWCDANRLEQVLVNLIGNALDAMAATHSPCLELAAGISESEEGEQRCTWIEVRDNGSGLSSNARAQLFEPFFTTKPPGAGLGLGLVISRDIIRGFGGDILVSDRPGGGTCFRLQVPSSAPSVS
ncbi:MAG: sensor histidine kinase [Proteobacteria bacterium]|nr:sensor histidine kinase [Pseudomonadota bacterium]